MIDITPVERCGRHFVEVSLDGHEMNRHGPFDTADEAEAMAVRLAGICKVLHSEVRMTAAAVRGR